MTENEAKIKEVTKAKNGQDSVMQWVTFKLANEVYGINVMQVKEVLRYVEIVPVPGAPSYVLGIINLRGTVVTIIDTRTRFGLPVASVTATSRIIIIEAGMQVIGILVDGVSEVINLNFIDIDDAPNVGTEESARFILGVTNIGEHLLILIDLDQLLTTKEWSDIALI